MAGGGGRGRGERKPQATSSSSSSSSSRSQKKAWVPRVPGGERSSEFQKEDPYSSSTSVGSKKTPQQMVTPVQTPKSVDSPSQIVTPVQPPKSAESPPQMVTPVQPPATSSSSRGQKARARNGPGGERSSEFQKEDPYSSSTSVGSKKTPQQMVTPVQTPKSVDSPSQIVTPVQPPKSAESPPQMVTPVQPPATSSSSSRGQKARARNGPGSERSSECQKEGPRSSIPSASSKKSPLDMVSPVQPPKYADSPLQTVTPVQPRKTVDPPPQMVIPVQPPTSLDAALQMGALFQRPKSVHSLPQMVASIQISKSVDSRSTSCGSGAVVSDPGAAPYDICKGESKVSVEVKPSLLEINRAKRHAREISESAAALQHLRPGMVLLKNFIKPDDQVKIIKQCRDLGVGTGGFYQPSYRDGAKLSLRMMCLGKKNWDPDSCYGDIRPFDGAKPLKIPEELTKFVNDAIEASHAFLKQSGQGKPNPEKEIPPMSPDICIVNFYTTAGKLGLHQDKDETIDSLANKLPVVSFSLGDTAEFLYGDTRDETKASKVKLESGDVLIFGGQSRHIFHGVSSITPKTAPTYVTKDANLRPGRLNLTFRQY